MLAIQLEEKKISFHFQCYIFCKGPRLDTVHVVCNCHEASRQPKYVKVKYICTYFIFTLLGKKCSLHLETALLLQWGFSQSLNYAKPFPKEVV